MTLDHEDMETAREVVRFLQDRGWTRYRDIEDALAPKEGGSITVEGLRLSKALDDLCSEGALDKDQGDRAPVLYRVHVPRTAYSTRQALECIARDLERMEEEREKQHPGSKASMSYAMAWSDVKTAILLIRKAGEWAYYEDGMEAMEKEDDDRLHVQGV